MRTVGEGQARDRTGMAVHSGKEVVRRGESGQKNMLMDLLLRRTLKTSYKKMRHFSLKKQKINSYPSVHTITILNMLSY